MRFLILITSGEKFEFTADAVEMGGDDYIIEQDKTNIAIFPKRNVVYIISMEKVTTVTND